MNSQPDFPVRAGRCCLGVLMMLVTSVVCAQAQPNPLPGPNNPVRPTRYHRPLQAAMAACDGQAAGAACNYIDREGKPRSGRCSSSPARLDDPSDRSSNSSNNRNITPPPPLVQCRPAR